MEASKVILSEAEHQLITNANVILTKNSSLEKISLLFGQLAAMYQEKSSTLKKAFPAVFGIHPKISKGEKHLGLPWIMLDYPRCFDKETGHLAIRTFFWWGNYFSIQLQVSGNYIPAFLQSIPKWSLEKNTWHIGLTHDAWDLQIPNPGWIDINEPSIKDSITNEMVLKLAKKIPLHEWENLERNFVGDYAALANLMEIALSTQAVK